MFLVACSLFLRDSLSSRFRKAHQVARDFASPWELMISSVSSSEPNRKVMLGKLVKFYLKLQGRCKENWGGAEGG